MKVTVKTIDLLNEAKIIENMIFYNRENEFQFLGLFKEYEALKFNDYIMKNSHCVNYEPVYTYISSGEYGNCILTVYCFNGDLFSVYDDTVYFEYTYQYKGCLERKLYKGILKTELKMNIKELRV